VSPREAAACRVLVAEDSPTARALLVAMLESEPGIRVVGEAASGEAAVREAARLRPDVITMDVHMPGLDGLQATRAIMSQQPTPILIVSALVTADVGLSLDATRAGALLVLPKPTSPSGPEFERERAQLVSMVKAMAGVKVVRRWTHGHAPDEPAAPPLRSSPARPAPAEVRLVAIAASTGGPAALRDVLAALPRDFPAPIVVVQHIARGFVGGLVQWLDGETPLAVRVARGGEPATPGDVYIAPDDRHLGVAVDGGALRLVVSDEPAVGTFRPSASYLFASAARSVGRGTMAVILTGMGDDGVSGLRDVHRAGGLVVAQDEATSVVYGMPREAVRAGVAHAVVPLPDIAAHLLAATSRRRNGHG